jgi:hypothetical protein
LVKGTGDLANFGVETDLQYNTFTTGDYARFSGGIVWDYFNSDFTVLTKLGAAYAIPGEGDAFVWPQANVELNLPLGRVFTVKAEGHTGVNKTSFAQMITINPYLSGASEVLFTKNVAGGKFALLHHPATKFGFMLGGGFDMYEDYQFYSDAPEATFLAAYTDVMIGRATLEAYWTPTEEDNITGNFTYFYGIVDSLDTQVPYLPDFQIELDYRKELFGFFVLMPEISYVSARYADLLNEDEIEDYIDLRLLADAELGSGLVLNFEARNLLDNDIYVWNGYRARGLFFSGGATWRF